MVWTIIILCLVAVPISVGLIRLLGGRFARAALLLDRPGGRKRHVGDIPLVGGLGMFLTLLLLSPLWLDVTEKHLWLLGILTVAVVAGVLDDRYRLNARVKLVPQGVLAMAVIYGAGMSFDNVGAILGETPVMLGGGAAVLFTLFAIIGTINTTNMADGLDGLAGGYLAIAFAALLYIAVQSGRVGDAQFLSVLLGAMIGFLYLNMRAPWRAGALVFMGDSGSMMLGLALAWSVLSLSTGPDAVMSPVVGALIFALPMYDILATLARRLFSGSHPFRADRRHVHYLLRDSGLPVGRVVAMLHGASLMIAVMALIGWRSGWPDNLMFLSFVLLFVGFLGFVCIARKGCRDELASANSLAAVDKQPKTVNQ
jgi:UDP-GlcNAc:undecaprenyl-phosphate GlcNAc-1-phosphate transferase